MTTEQRQRVNIPISGMHCAACVSKVESALSGVPGVGEAHANLAAANAGISCDVERVSLPAVEQASIREDLYRRDFTINALAVSLKGEDFGRLVDFFGGLREEDVAEVLQVSVITVKRDWKAARAWLAARLQ